MRLTVTLVIAFAVQNMASSPWSIPPKQQHTITPGLPPQITTILLRDTHYAMQSLQLVTLLQAEVSVHGLPGPNQQLLQHLLSQHYATSQQCSVLTRTLEPQTPNKTMGTSVQLGAGIAQCHNY